MTNTDPPPSRIDAISTLWSLMRRAGDGGSPSVEAARRELVMRYSSAIRGYVRALVRDEQDADELAQDVVVRMLKGDFAGADPQRGRFRDLLKTAIRNMVRNHWTKQNRRKEVALAGEKVIDAPSKSLAGGDRQGDDLLANRSPTEKEGQPPDPWLIAWRRSVLDLAWTALQQFQRTHPTSMAYTVLRLRAKYPDDTSDQLAARISQQLGKKVQREAVRQNLRRARIRFAELLVQEVAAGLDPPDGDRVEDELLALELHSLVCDHLPQNWKETLIGGGS